MKQIFLNGIVYEWTLEDIIWQCQGMMSGEQCEVIVNSPGGDLFTGMAIYNHFLGMNPKPTFKINSMAGSIASVICLSGKTLIAETGMMFLHNPGTSFWDTANADQMRKTADMLDKVKQPMLTAYCKKTGMSEEEIQALLDAETYLTAQEAVDMKLADGIYSPDVIENKAMFKFAAQMKPKNNSQILNKETSMKTEAEILAMEQKIASLEAQLKDVPATNVTSEMQNKVTALETELNKLQPLVKKVTDLETEKSTLADRLMRTEVDSQVEKLIAEARLPRGENDSIKNRTVTKLLALKKSEAMFDDKVSCYDVELEDLKSRPAAVSTTPVGDKLNLEFKADNSSLKEELDYITEYNKSKGAK